MYLIIERMDLKKRPRPFETLVRSFLFFCAAFSAAATFDSSEYLPTLASFLRVSNSARNSFTFASSATISSLLITSFFFIDVSLFTLSAMLFINFI